MELVTLRTLYFATLYRERARRAAVAEVVASESATIAGPAPQAANRS